MELRRYSIYTTDEEDSLCINVSTYIEDVEQLTLPADLSEYEQIVNVMCTITSTRRLPLTHTVYLDKNNDYQYSYVHSNQSQVYISCPANKLLETIKIYDKAHTIHRCLQQVFTAKRWKIYKHLKCDDCSDDIFVNAAMDYVLTDSEKYYKFGNLPKHKISKKWQKYIQHLDLISQSDCDTEARQTILDFINTLNDFDFVVNHNKRIFIKSKKDEIK